MHSAVGNEYMIVLANFLMFLYLSHLVFILLFAVFFLGLGVKITKVLGVGFFHSF